MNDGEISKWPQASTNPTKNGNKMKAKEKDEMSHAKLMIKREKRTKPKQIHTNLIAFHFNESIWFGAKIAFYR